jgi:predicted amidohydrolase YtcJ
LADFAVFSRNFLEEPADHIADARVVLTLVDGKVAYEAN